MHSQALLPSFTNNPVPRHARSALHQLTNSHYIDFVEFRSSFTVAYRSSENTSYRGDANIAIGLQCVRTSGGGLLSRLCHHSLYYAVTGHFLFRMRQYIIFILRLCSRRAGFTLRHPMALHFFRSWTSVGQLYQTHVGRQSVLLGLPKPIDKKGLCK